MNRPTKASIVLIVIMLLILTSLLAHHWKSKQEELPVNSSALRTFLESQYVPEIELLRASVTSYPDNETIYIANDNLLAARALIILDSSLGKRIKKNLDENYSGGWNGKVDVLLGRPINGFFCSETDTIGKAYSKKFHSEFTVKYERVNLSYWMGDWGGYADLLAYAAINETLNGNRTKAIQFYHSLLSMWDGSGFRDKAFNGMYQTYKCALFIYLYRALGKPEYGGTIYKQCLKVISRLQGENGGITTAYRIENGKIIRVGDANTETTSIVALALYSDFPERPQT